MSIRKDIRIVDVDGKLQMPYILLGTEFCKVLLKLEKIFIEDESSV
uniref:Uncharacterized protein n=1 Tax=Romanomermis culicivorax TaxID=13658 RepID=A0A915I7K8_ROMCU